MISISDYFGRFSNVTSEINTLKLNMKRTCTRSTGSSESERVRSADTGP